MDRRQFLLIALGATALPGAVQTAHAECGEETGAEFVTALYEKEARRLAAKTPSAEDDFCPLFARELRQIMRAPRHYPKGEPIGHLLHAFFGRGVLPGTEVEIGKVTRVSGKDDGPALIGVAVSYRGASHKILVRVVREKGDWRIADISYDSGRSLADHYRRMTGR